MLLGRLVPVFPRADLRSIDLHMDGIEFLAFMAGCAPSLSLSNYDADVNGRLWAQKGSNDFFWQILYDPSRSAHDDLHEPSPTAKALQDNDIVGIYKPKFKEIRWYHFTSNSADDVGRWLMAKENGIEGPTAVELFKTRPGIILKDLETGTSQLTVDVLDLILSRVETARFYEETSALFPSLLPTDGRPDIYPGLPFPQAAAMRNVLQSIITPSAQTVSVPQVSVVG